MMMMAKSLKTGEHIEVKLDTLLRFKEMWHYVFRVILNDIQNTILLTQILNVISL